MHNATYITEAPAADNSLRAYVNRLDTRIEYATWKQDLVLKYNYMPLASIREKLQASYTDYMAKMQAEDARLRRLVDNEEIIRLLGDLGRFRDNMQRDLHVMEAKISQQRAVLMRLKQEAQAKKTRLKSIMCANIGQMTERWREGGVSSVLDLHAMARSRSTTSKMQTARTQARTPHNQTPVKHIAPVHLIYRQCMMSILSMKNPRPKPATQSKEEEKTSFISKYKSGPEPQEPVQGSRPMDWDRFVGLTLRELVELLKSNKRSLYCLEKLIAS